MRLGTLPVAAAILVGLNGLYLALVAVGNITDFGTNQLFVQHVLSMDTTNFGGEPGTRLDPDVMWRAVESEPLQDLAYLLVIAWEVLTAVVLLGSLRFWARGTDDGYVRARAASTIGLVMVVLLFLGGFIAIGGEWFQMWRSTDWNGLDPAFRNAVLALVTLVLVQMPSSHWGPAPGPKPQP